MCHYQPLLSETTLSTRIHQFVLGVLRGSVKYEDYEENIHNWHIQLTALANKNINYQFSNTINIFMQSYQQNCIIGYHQDSSIIDFCLSGFVDNIINSKRLIDEELLAWQKQELRNRGNLLNYVEQLLNHYSRLLFVRVDLAYRKDSQHLISIADVDRHKKQLLKYLSNGDTCFANLQGYAWALEQGADKGYHIHLLLMYDGSKRQKDYYLADEVGKLWHQMTGGVGYHFNCNTPEHKRQFIERGKLGVGMIHRKNPDEVDNALNVASYLVNPEKDSQMLLVKLPNIRTFGKASFRIKGRRRLS